MWLPAIVLLVGVAIFVLGYALPARYVARRLGVPGSKLAFVPIGDLVVLARCAGKEPGRILAWYMLGPFLGAAMWMVLLVVVLSGAGLPGLLFVLTLWAATSEISWLVYAYLWSRIAREAGMGTWWAWLAAVPSPLSWIFFWVIAIEVEETGAAAFAPAQG